MQKAFDIGLDSLVGGELGSVPESSFLANAPQRGTFYLETFGCQMNEHDSEKVAGVLLSRGYRQVDSVEAASFVLYNTCSIREKAAQKVFSRLGEFRPFEGQLAAAKGLEGDTRLNPRKVVNAGGGKIIGVLGCVAQQ